MKKYLMTICFWVVLIGFTTYVLLDTFVLSSVYQTNTTQVNTTIFETAESIQETESSSIETEEATESTEHISTDETSYSNDHVSITISTYREYDTDIYVADIYTDSIECLKTAFAENTYGKNVTETTSAQAEENNAILAINGDFYGAQESGYVIRNGVIYRDTASDNDVLCINADGTMQVVSAQNYTAEELLNNGVWQAFSFGPGLVENFAIAVTEEEEVGKAMASNPRTAIGMMETGHYIMVVSDGRTDESEGLSLYELAEFMQDLGCETAYNLDGGGSSTMYFNGQVINNPTTNGRIKEREVSDIVYIGA